MKNNATQYGFLAVIITIVISFAYGWITNIMQVASADYSTFEGMEILRIVGIFVAPLGAVLGYI